MDRHALYYQDPYTRAFSAEVLDCVPCEAWAGQDPAWAVRLSVHGFYPEGGGQPADRGSVGEARLWDVRETPDGQILHYLDRPLQPGRRYDCLVDWEWRFRLMQNHTGEHILSGLLHRRLSLENTGFHMAMEGGEPVITIDMDGKAGWDALMEIEEEANRAICADLPVAARFPGAAELDKLMFRKKRPIPGDVRIVEIGGGEIDRCACCGLHVARTGEVGLLKILSAASHRGGIRMELICGLDASRRYRALHEAAGEAARRLSVRAEGLPEAVRRCQEELAAKDLRIAALHERCYALKAAGYAREYGSGREAVLCDFEEGMQGIELRRFCDYLMKHTGAAVVAVFGREEAPGDAPCLYRYALGSLSVDVRPLGKRLNQRFQGRGGGRRELVQGSIRGQEEAIRAFLREKQS